MPVTKLSKRSNTARYEMILGKSPANRSLFTRYTMHVGTITTQAPITPVSESRVSARRTSPSTAPTSIKAINEPMDEGGKSVHEIECKHDAEARDGGDYLAFGQRRHEHAYRNERRAEQEEAEKRRIASPVADDAEQAEYHGYKSHANAGDEQHKYHRKILTEHNVYRAQGERIK